jgi:hypothetical protein
MAAMTEAIEEIRCRRCALAPSVGQLRFFEEGSEGGEVGAVYDGAAAVKDNENHWPHVETSSCGRDGFWRERTPMVFGSRSGVGPLLMMPDTNILIEIRKQLSEVEGGLIIHPQWGAHDDPVDALREVVQLWWFRDVRFAVSPQHLVDSRRKPLTGDRWRAREDAIRELEIDFFERGGVEAVVSEEWSVEDRPCALHAIPPPHLSTSSTATKDWGWPKDDLDRRLVEAAYDSGCHVFLTADKGILKCHASLFPRGLAVMSPGQLLEALDSSGELDGTRGLHFPVPNLSTLTRLYAGSRIDGVESAANHRAGQETPRIRPDPSRSRPRANRSRYGRRFGWRRGQSPRGEALRDVYTKPNRGYYTRER